jgi:hypothetical protein
MKEEEIRSALEGATRETLADALAMVLAEGNAPSTSAVGMSKPELKNFAQAVQYLKNQYDFAELDLFTTEADLVYVQAGDRRVLLTDRTNERIRPVQERESDRQIENNASPSVEKKEENQDPFDNGNGGRFSHLEL